MATSDFRAGWTLGVLVEPDCELLAWRAHLARPPFELGVRGLVFRHIVAGFFVLGDGGSVKPVRIFSIPTAGNRERDFSVAGGILFLALLSIQFDFGESTGPTRIHPYFTAGRLLSGALIPFALMYVCGIAFVLRRAKRAVLPRSIILGFVAVTAVSEIAANRDVFASEHNWFHR